MVKDGFKKENYEKWKARTGRPISKLTPEITEKIAQYVRNGNYLDTSAQACGVSKRTLFSWLKKANDEIERLEDNPDAPVDERKEIYIQFKQEIDQAQAEAEINDIEKLKKFEVDNPSTILFRLRCRYPNKWNEKVNAKIEYSGGTENTNTNINKIELDEELIKKYAEDFMERHKNETE